MHPGLALLVLQVSFKTQENCWLQTEELLIQEYISWSLHLGKAKIDWQLSAASHKRRPGRGDDLGNHSSFTDHRLLCNSTEPGRKPCLFPPFSYKTRLSLAYQEHFLYSAAFLTFTCVLPSPGAKFTLLCSYAIRYRNRLRAVYRGLSIFSCSVGIRLNYFSPSILLIHKLSITLTTLNDVLNVSGKAALLLVLTSVVFVLNSSLCHSLTILCTTRCV